MSQPIYDALVAEQGFDPLAVQSIEGESESGTTTSAR